MGLLGNLQNKVSNQLGVGNKQQNNPSNPQEQNNAVSSQTSTQRQSQNSAQGQGQNVRAGNRQDIIDNAAFGNAQRQAQAQRNGDSSSGYYVNQQSRQSIQQNQQFGNAQRQAIGQRNGAANQNNVQTAENILGREYLKSVGITNPKLLNATNQKMINKLYNRQFLPNYNTNFGGSPNTTTFINNKTGKETYVRNDKLSEFNRTGYTEVTDTMRTQAKNASQANGLGYQISSDKNVVGYINPVTGQLVTTTKQRLPTVIWTKDSEGRNVQNQVTQTYDNTGTPYERNIDWQTIEKKVTNPEDFVAVGNKQSIERNKEMQLAQTTKSFNIPLLGTIRSVDQRTNIAQEIRTSNFVKGGLPQTYQSETGVRITQQWADEKGIPGLGGVKVMDIIGQAGVIGSQKILDRISKGIDLSNVKITPKDSYINDAVQSIKIGGTGKNYTVQRPSYELAFRLPESVGDIPFVNKIDQSDLAISQKGTEAYHRESILLKNPGKSINQQFDNFYNTGINAFREKPITTTANIQRQGVLTYGVGGLVGAGQKVGGTVALGAQKRIPTLQKYVKPRTVDVFMKRIDNVDDFALQAFQIPFSQGYQTNVWGNVQKGKINPLSWAKLDPERTYLNPNTGKQMKNAFGSQAWMDSLLYYAQTEAPAEYAAGKAYGVAYGETPRMTLNSKTPTGYIYPDSGYGIPGQALSQRRVSTQEFGALTPSQRLEDVYIPINVKTSSELGISTNTRKQNYKGKQLSSEEGIPEFYAKLTNDNYITNQMEFSDKVERLIMNHPYAFTKNNQTKIITPEQQGQLYRKGRIEGDYLLNAQYGITSAEARQIYSPSYQYAQNVRRRYEPQNELFIHGDLKDFYSSFRRPTETRLRDFRIKGNDNRKLRFYDAATKQQVKFRSPFKAQKTNPFDQDVNQIQKFSENLIAIHPGTELNYVSKSEYQNIPNSKINKEEQKSIKLVPTIEDRVRKNMTPELRVQMKDSMNNFYYEDFDFKPIEFRTDDTIRRENTKQNRKQQTETKKPSQESIISFSQKEMFVNVTPKQAINVYRNTLPEVRGRGFRHLRVDPAVQIQEQMQIQPTMALTTTPEMLPTIGERQLITSRQEIANRPEQTIRPTDRIPIRPEPRPDNRPRPQFKDDLRIDLIPPVFKLGDEEEQKKKKSKTGKKSQKIQRRVLEIKNPFEEQNKKMRKL